MPAHPQSRSVPGRAVSEFLDTAAVEPAALVVAGEAGIGKTTLWLSAVQQAGDRGFRVLSARDRIQIPTDTHSYPQSLPNKS